MKYPPNLYKMPLNYRVLRSLDWIKIPTLRIYNDSEVWGWLGDNAGHHWSYRDHITGPRNYYFEDKQDAEWFVLRWA